MYHEHKVWAMTITVNMEPIVVMLLYMIDASREVMSLDIDFGSSDDVKLISYIITDNEEPSAIDFTAMIISSSIIGIFGQIC